MAQAHKPAHHDRDMRVRLPHHDIAVAGKPDQAEAAGAGAALMPIVQPRCHGTARWRALADHHDLLDGLLAADRVLARACLVGDKVGEKTFAVAAAAIVLVAYWV